MVAVIRPSRSIVTPEYSQPPVGSDADGPMPHTSTYIASPRPTSRPSARAASRSAFNRFQSAAFSADGQRFVMVKDDSASGRVNIVLNWFEELKARVPTK